MFGLSPEEEKEEIISEAQDLYGEIVNGDRTEVYAGRTAYKRSYKKILEKAEDYFGRDLINGIPEFMNDLIQVMESDEGNIYLKKETEIKNIEFGLKTLLKKFKASIPEKMAMVGSREGAANPNTIVINPSFTQAQATNISIDVKTKVERLRKEFDSEISKENPDKLKLREIFNTIFRVIGWFG